MALLNNNNEYIILKDNNEYLVYDNPTSRENIKKRVDSDTVISTYIEILEELDSLLKTNPTDELNKKYEDYLNEYTNYKNDLRLLDGNKHTYPLMNKYFMYVELTIPKIKERGKLNLKGDTLKDKYEYAKSKKLFGKTLDI